MCDLSDTLMNRDLLPALAALGLLLSFASPRAQCADREARVPLLAENEAWARLPQPEPAAPGRLPNWARALAGPLPRTTAAMLELDWKQRARSPLDPKLRAKLRYVAAQANRCDSAMATARADFVRAGGVEPELDSPGSSPGERRSIAFVRQLTIAADQVTDEQVAALLADLGEQKLTAMVLLAAYANFQDRLLLSLGIPLEANGPLPPLEVAFPSPGGADPPARTRPEIDRARPEVPVRVDDPEWRLFDWKDLVAKVEAQKSRAGRIRVPSWDEVRPRYPADVKAPDKPLRIQWSLVTMGYAPELAGAWLKCMRTFASEAAQDRVFEESLFWVVTRTLHCFY